MALLALAAADDFADARRQHVHGGHRSAIVVAAHVERFDAFRIIGHDHRLVEHFLGKEAFMLALHVHAPLGGEFEILAGFRQQPVGLGVRDAHEAGIHQAVERLAQFRVVPLRQEVQVRPAPSTNWSMAGPSAIPAPSSSSITMADSPMPRRPNSIPKRPTLSKSPWSANWRTPGLWSPIPRTTASTMSSKPSTWPMECSSTATPAWIAPWALSSSSPANSGTAWRLPPAHRSATRPEGSRCCAWPALRRRFPNSGWVRRWAAAGCTSACSFPAPCNGSPPATPGPATAWAARFWPISPAP